MKKIISILVFLTIPASVFSWTNHFLGTYLSLEVSDEISKAKPVKVESIESFLKKEGANITKILDEIEEQSIKEIENYPVKPTTIQYDPNAPNTKESFLKALRLNPTIKLKLYIQELPGANIAGKKRLKASEITIFDKDEYTEMYLFTELKDGSTVAPISVVASAADEPDYGHDIGLFSDNDTEFGKQYNFGTTPFGDPRLFYASQAPFHMSFFYESPIIYAAAPAFKRTFPEVRILQFYKLAKYAFQTGHDYWGYRFMGWAMHYLGDLTQPYHSTLIPGIGTSRALWVNTKAMLGFDGGKKEITERMSDRHTAIEHYQFDVLFEMISKKDFQNDMILSYKKKENDSKYREFDLKYAREVIAKESNSKSEEFDKKIGSSDYIMIFKAPQVKKEGHSPDAGSREVDAFINQLFISFGSHMRNFAKKTLQKE
jgi:hypothetical protein